MYASRRFMYTVQDCKLFCSVSPLVCSSEGVNSFLKMYLMYNIVCFVVFSWNLLPSHWGFYIFSILYKNSLSH